MRTSLARIAAVLVTAAAGSFVLPVHAAVAAELPVVRMPDSYICWEAKPSKQPTGLARRALTATDQASCQVPVELSEPSPDKVLVTYRIEGLTAKPDADFVDLGKGELVIEAGESKGFVNLLVLADCEREAEETLSVELVEAYGAKIETWRTLVTIVDQPGDC